MIWPAEMTRVSLWRLVRGLNRFRASAEMRVCTYGKAVSKFSLARGVCMMSQILIVEWVNQTLGYVLEFEGVR